MLTSCVVAIVATQVDFARDVQPVLASRCFACHGPDANTREAGLRLDDESSSRAMLKSGVAAIVPGDPEASELMVRIMDHGDPMPPEGDMLSEADVEALREWIASGATYETHWSFVPPVDPPLPPVRDESWVRHPLDTFVLSRMEEAGFEPEPEADRMTLLRRVSLDLTGLPPSEADVEAFRSDTEEGAYERAVDRLLSSPHFGERWARPWLDLARYADTKGYEKDSERTVWPWRDWVIDALNSNMPYDLFTIEQIAGDMLDDADASTLIATTFHRNTMTNDEGGTDDEEFRVAAVVDRVNTTMQAWMGLTMSCAQCHTHKYDPITHTDYYRVFAVFNSTQDADRPDEAPTYRVRTDEIRERLAALDAERDALEREVLAALDRFEYHDPGPVTPGAERLWIDDETPTGAVVEVHGGGKAWPWIEGGPIAPVSGTKITGGVGKTDVYQHYVHSATDTIRIQEGDVLFASVHLDPTDPPREIMMQWHDSNGSWEHRVVYGEDLIGWGQPGTTSRRHMGDLPESGRWVRLEVPASDVGLMPGSVVTGWALTQHSGTVHWDALGVRRSPASESFEAWLATDAAHEIPEAERERHYLLEVNTQFDRSVRAERDRLATLASERTQVAAQGPVIPIMRELDSPRETHLLIRGSHLDKGEAVTPGVPEALHEGPSSPDRLSFAHWLVDEANPLTARVAVNRFWEQIFGIGLVETSEDFGVQGELPSHPDLLDHLAVSFASDWDVKRLLKTIVTSSTYRQASTTSSEKRAGDPRNRLLTRSPRYRLAAEVVRDQALATSGLLSRRLHGPPVYPPQPDGIWQMPYSGARWMTSEGENRYRRAIYTYWRRTAPYPSMLTFDAPSREFCVPRRIRTNTPLQALTTLNDPVYVEAAQALARWMVDADGEASTIASRGFERCLLREPSAEELGALTALYEDALAHYGDVPQDAMRMATDPLGPLDEGADVASMAAWTVVANVLLNMDEYLTRG